MIAIYDKTPVSWVSGTSDACVVYKRLPTRPQVSRCDVIDECPDCALDTAFKYPVSESDTLYFQFHQADNYNTNPQAPEVGWFDGLSLDYYIRAYLEFADGTEQVISLGQPDIWVSANVGWNNGSYQNLILSAQGIKDFMTEEGKGICFRIRVETCRFLQAVFTEVVWTKPSLPSPDEYEEGDLAFNSGALYILESGSWVFSRNLVNGEYLLNTSNGQYYEWNNPDLDKVARPIGELDCDSDVCYTAWHKFINCEDTILINGVFGFEDCLGNYYGVSAEDAANGILPYQDKYRLEASFELQRIFEENEVNENDVVTSFVQKEEWLFRNIKSLPEQVVRRFSNSCIAQYLYIDSNQYKQPSERARLNDTGHYWWIAVSMTRDLCEKTNDCDVDYVFNPIANCPECVECEECCESFTLNIYVDGVLSDTQTLDACPNETINIVWI